MKQLDGLSKYSITPCGRVYNHPKEKYCKLHTQLMKGKPMYLNVWLSDDNKRGKWYKVHRLVAMAYIDNPHNYPEVNHKDGNKHNNNVDNLEWTTHSRNIQHSYDIGRVHIGKPMTDEHKAKLMAGQRAYHAKRRAM